MFFFLLACIDGKRVFLSLFLLLLDFINVRLVAPFIVFLDNPKASWDFLPIWLNVLLSPSKFPPLLLWGVNEFLRDVDILDDKDFWGFKLPDLKADLAPEGLDCEFSKEAIFAFS